MWEQLVVASELESNVRDTIDLGKKWFVHFNAGKSGTFYLCVLS